MSSPPSERGAYGFRLGGVDGARELLVDAPADWPLLDLRWRVDQRAEAAAHRGRLRRG